MPWLSIGRMQGVGSGYRTRNADRLAAVKPASMYAELRSQQILQQIRHRARQFCTGLSFQQRSIVSAEIRITAYLALLRKATDQPLGGLDDFPLWSGLAPSGLQDTFIPRDDSAGNFQKLQGQATMKQQSRVLQPSKTLVMRSLLTRIMASSSAMPRLVSRKLLSESFI